MNEDFKMYQKQVDKSLVLACIVGRLMGVLDFLHKNDKLKEGTADMIAPILNDIQKELKELFPD